MAEKPDETFPQILCVGQRPERSPIAVNNQRLSLLILSIAVYSFPAPMARGITVS